MTDDVVSPDQLRELKQPLIEAVINAYMFKNTAVIGELERDWGSCAEGEFRYQLWDNYKFYCYYPSGEWRQDIFGPDRDVDSPSEIFNTGAYTFDAVAAWTQIEEEVSRWVDGLLYDSPDPASFENQINSVANIVTQLYVQDEVMVGGEVVNGSGSSDTNGPVSDVREAITDVGTLLDDMEAGVIDALQMVYASDVALTFSGQRAMATVAGLAIAGEATAWNNTYKDLKTFLENATTDFDSFAKSGPGSGSGTAKELTILSGVATIGAGATVAIAPVAGALTAVAGLASIGAAFWPVEEAVEPTEIVLSGSTFDEYFTAFTNCLRDIDRELTAAERALSSMCDNVIADFHANPGSYSLTKLESDGSRQNSEDLRKFTQSRIRFSPWKMREVGGRIESVGQHQRDLAGVLGGVDGRGSASALVEFEWDRGTMGGIVLGSGFQGPYGSYSLVVDTLVDLLMMESRTATRIAEHCFASASGFETTEAENLADAREKAEEFDSIPIPVANPR